MGPKADLKDMQTYLVVLIKKPRVAWGVGSVDKSVYCTSMRN